jgi:DNA-binding SARP family transcriptional activator
MFTLGGVHLRFGVLGPLEISDNNVIVDIHGTKQRAALAFLLFNANRVVSTSELLNTLWPTGESPNSARKILHNAIWGLRAALTPREGATDEHAALITRPPGYVLQLETETVDLYRFQRLASDGHAHLLAGEYAAAARTLRQGLDLWRGGALADLVEAGFCWPEVAAVENVRIDAVEDYFDAELARGRHQSVLREIEGVVDGGPPRERLCGQLMLALYRCGRQTDALDMYNGMRDRLVDELGLEPGRALQDLQQAILRHDGSLGGAEAAPRVEVITIEPPPKPQATEWASVLMVQTAVDVGNDDDMLVDHTLAGVDTTFRNVVDLLGGSVVPSSGSVWTAMFTDSDGVAERAVSAALAMVGCLAGSSAAGQPMTIRAAVATGVGGLAADNCQALLARTVAGTVRACDTTRELTGPAVSYWASRVRHAHWQSVAHPSIPIIDRDWELDVLGGLLERSRHRLVAQLVTVLGDAGAGKTRLVLEFERRAMAKWADIKFLVVTPDASGRPLGLLKDLLMSLCGVDPRASADSRVRALRAVVNSYVVDLDEAEGIVGALGGLIRGQDAQVTVALEAGTALLRAVAASHPMVIFADDGHDLDDASLDFLESLAGAVEPPSLMVILAARPRLLHRRQNWGGGHHESATLTLTPLSDTAVDRLAAIVAARLRREQLSVPTVRFQESLTDEAQPRARRAAMRTLMLFDSVLSTKPSMDASGVVVPAQQEWQAWAPVAQAP